MRNEEHRILFEPIRLAGCRVKNRLVMAPMGQLGLADADGCYTPDGVEHYVRRARGGAGLLITGCCYTSAVPQQLPAQPCPTFKPNHFVRTATPLTERVHAHGAKIFLQAAAYIPNRTTLLNTTYEGVRFYGPSRLPHRWIKGAYTEEMTLEHIHEVVESYRRTARVAKDSGFDGIEVHAVHEGYLLDQFTMSFYNHRTDQYGGSLENRLRFPIEVLEAIKEECGPGYPVILRYTVTSLIKDFGAGAMPGEVFSEKGRTLEEGVAAARLFEKAGYDALDADVGSYESWYWAHPPMYLKKGMYLEYTKALKTAVTIPVITAGRMDDLALAVSAVKNGDTDMIGLARPMLVDPDWPNKVLRGEIERIRPCISCQEGCMGRIEGPSLLSCALRPETGREITYGLSPAPYPKRVVVVGAGIAGMEAARVCAIRGHAVCIYEKTGEAGGHVIAGGVPDFKIDDRRLLAWYKNELRILNVPIYYNTQLTEDSLAALDADAYVFATGSAENTLPLQGGGLEKLVGAEDTLRGRHALGNRVVVVGGGLVGLETALWLREQGKEVTVVEREECLLPVNRPLCSANAEMIIDLMPFKGIGVELRTTACEVIADGLVTERDGVRATIPCDNVVVCVGYRPDCSLYERMLFRVKEAYLVGDALEARTILHAVWTSYEVARGI